MDPNKLTETVNKTLENNTIAPTLNNAQNLESSTLEIPIKKNDNSLLENPVQEPASPQEMENPIGRVPSSNEESNSQENGINPETKVDAGKQINENGELVIPPTKRVDTYLFMYRRDFGLALRDYFTLICSMISL